MLLNNLRNKKLIKKFSEKKSYCNFDRDLIENKLVKAKDKNMYVIVHVQFSNEDGSLSHRGKYRILNNRCKDIGYLNYVFYENSNPKYMILGDIHLDNEYRNIGLGSTTLKLFEDRAKSYGADHIVGDLSSVDEGTPEDKKLRNIFYVKRGYEIIDLNKIYKVL